MILKLVSDRTYSRSQNLRLIFESFVVFVLYKMALVYISSHSSYFVCFLRLQPASCVYLQTTVSSLRVIMYLDSERYELACSSPLPHSPLPRNRLYLIWNVYQCMCFRLLVGHNCSHLIFVRTCFQSSDNVLIVNYC